MNIQKLYNMKKTFRFFAALAVLCLPSALLAQHFETGGRAYNVLSEEDHTVELTMRWSGSPYGGNFTVPSTVTYGGVTYDVVALGEYAFYRANLTSVAIPTSVTRIKTQCFLLATGPVAIYIPASVTDIEEMALVSLNMSYINVSEDNPNYCTIDGLLYSKDSMTIVQCPPGKSGAITLPQSTQHIGRFSFAYGQSITDIPLHEGITSIGYGAFMFASSLSNITIPSSVSFIGSNLFEGCTALNTLSIASGNSHYYLDGMMIYSMGGDTLVSCHKSEDSLYLPATLRVVGGMGGNSDVRYVHIPDGVTKINENAFEGSSLQSIDIPNSVAFIDEYAFVNCESLIRVVMPETLDTMGQGCFEYCTSLTSIDIPDGLHTIPHSAFFGSTALSHITWGNAVAVIDSFAFGGCSFTELYLPATLRSVRAGVFNGYYDGVLRRISFSAPIDTIEPEAFAGHHLESLRLMNNLPPVSLITLEYGADYGCLIDATVDSIIIPCGSLNAYLTDSYWGLFTGKYYEDCNGIDGVKDGEIIVYPNPVVDWLTICLGNNNYYQYIKLVNNLGESVFSSKIVGSNVEIDVSNIERGIYLLCLYNSDGITTKKVILQ